MGKQRKGLRTFYYFRLGYAQYLALGIGIINVLTATYFLAIERIPSIKSFLPTFESYVLFCIVIGLPMITFFGWLHFKRIGTYSTEISIALQNSPYNYKWQPGFTKEVFAPAYASIINSNSKLIKEESLSKSELEQILELETKLKNLIDGGYVGNPPKGAFK